MHKRVRQERSGFMQYRRVSHRGLNCKGKGPEGRFHLVLAVDYQLDKIHYRALFGAGRMTDEDGTDEVTLTLTQAEAEALNSLALDAAYRRFAGRDSDDMVPLEKLDPATSARAVDKLQRVIIPDLPETSTITFLLKKMYIS
jgi:hypothetical protein